MSEPCSQTHTGTIILAAGVGRRLGGDGRPKCLLEFGGRSLLSRHLDALRTCGIGNVTLVVGHDAARVEAAAGPGVTCVLNPDFREGSVVSLWTARDALTRGGRVLLMDADVIYDRRVLARLLDGDGDNILLLDRELEPGDEPVKICVSGERIVDFRKRPEALHDWHGESVGFFSFAPDAAAELARRAGDYVATGRRGAEYEEPIRDMILSSHPGRFRFEDVTGLPWTEIDFAEDVVKAHALLPELLA